MESIKNLLIFPEKSKNGSERSDLLGQLYDLYLHDIEKRERKIHNWNKFVLRCKMEKLDHKNPLVIEAYKKSKFFIKEYNIKTFCIRLAHVPTQDLYYVLSVCKDKHNQNKSAFKWLFSAIKPGYGIYPQEYRNLT